MCRVPHCTRPPGGGRKSAAWATLCNTHRHRERRHGDPLQEPILAAHLTPYLRSLDKRRNVQPNAPIWGFLATRWETLIDQCRGILRSHAGGDPGNRWQFEAAAELVRVSEQASPENAWRTAAAMFMLQDYEPRRFASDAAFFVQLGRRVRHLAPADRRSFVDPSTGGTTFSYRDPNPRTAVIIGQMLAETFGVAGTRFAQQDRKEMEQQQAERTAFYAALNEVAPMVDAEGQ